MPTKDQHIEKAKNNEAFAQRIDPSTAVNCEWAVTASFYAALHYVEAYFATKNRHYDRHGDRESAIERDVNIKELWQDYRVLKRYSRRARYYPVRFERTDILNATPPLQKIRAYLSPFF